MSIDRFEAEALKLSRGARARLAEVLIASLDEDAEVERAWEEEAEHRYQRYLAGEANTLPVAQALAEVEEQLKR